MKHASASFRVVALFGLVAMLAVASEAVAGGVADYYPLRLGYTWQYATKKHTKISRLFEVKEADKHGTVEQRVVGASRLSTERLKVFAVRNTVEERGSSIAPVVRIETVLHLSSSAQGVLLHAIDAGGVDGLTLPAPAVILRDPPAAEPVKTNVGTMAMTSSVKSQTVEAVEVPAGKFAKALKQVTEGPVSGALSGLPVRSGTLTETSWFVPHVGLVRQERTLDIRVNDEAGVEVRVQETAQQALKKFSTRKNVDARSSGE